MLNEIQTASLLVELQDPAYDGLSESEARDLLHFKPIDELTMQPLNSRLELNFQDINGMSNVVTPEDFAAVFAMIGE